MTTRRDNFSEKTRMQIARLAGGLCAYPGCRVATFGASADGAAVLDIGIAAHICAAAPGGPRFDQAMSPTERAAAANGIWMCADHGRAIDADPKFYTVEKLRKWKREAEHDAFLRVTRHPNAAPASVDYGDIVAAARADLVVLRQMPKWPRSSIALTLKVDGFDEPMTTTGLAAAAQQIEDLILTAPPGMGKTTTLLQIGTSVLDEGNGAPIFVGLGDWASENRGILASILARSAFHDIDEKRFRAAAAATSVVLLLDGWNELNDDARTRARIELVRLKAEIPQLALVITTRRQALDVPLTGKRVDLLPLSESQQLEIAQAIGGDAGADLLDRAWRTHGVRDLVEIPLYLTVLLSLGAGPFPETREEVLRRFVAAHESEPRRAEELARAVNGFQATFLRGLATVATRAANTAIPDSDARRALTGSVTTLMDDGQLSYRIDPGAILATLVDNTVLVRAAERSGVAFQHQQFQEWFASHEVERLIVEAASSGEARRLLQTSILDKPAWEEAILFAIERMARSGAREQDACSMAILAAFQIDPMLAAEMIYRATDSVWRTVEKSMVAKVDRWHVPGEPDRAFRFMMLSARPEFLDRVWPLISDIDKQASLRALRVSNGLRPRILGAGAVQRLRDLPTPARKVMLSELAMDGGPEALDLATDIAVSDSDAEVQRKVIDALSFRSADRHLSRLLKRVPDAVLDLVVSRRLPLPIGGDPELLARLDAARNRVTQRETPYQELQDVAFGGRDYPGAEALKALILAMDLRDRSDTAVNLIYQAHADHPRDVAEALLERILLGKPIFYRAGDLIAPADLAREDQALVRLVLEDGERSDRAVAAASALGPKAAGTLVDAIIAQLVSLSDRPKPYDKPGSERLHALQERLAAVPGRSLVAAIRDRSRTADNATLARYARLLSRGKQEDLDRVRPYDDETLEEVRTLAASWGERLLVADDISRSEVAKIADLISHVPAPRFLGLLRRMLDDNLRRLADFRAAAEATRWQQIDVASEGRTPMTEYYLRAFRAIDDPATRALMLEYLDHPDFGEEAARVLCEQWIARNRPAPERRFIGGIDFASVAERRAECAANPTAITEEADAILAATERLIASEPDSAALGRAVTLAGIAAQMPHGGHDETYLWLVEHAHWRMRTRLLLQMALSGDAIAIETIERGLAEMFEIAKKETWILVDGNAWLLRDWLQLLPLASDLTRLAAIVATIPQRERRDDRLETLINGLGAMSNPGAEQALFDLADLQPSLLRNHAWSTAALKSTTASGIERLIAVIADDKKVGGRGSRSWGLHDQLGERLSEFPEVRRNLIGRLRGSESSPGNRPLAFALAHKPDIEALELLIELERAWDIWLIDHRTLEALVTERVPSPEWTNTYSIVPKPATELRRRLLYLTTDGSALDRASILLTRIDRIRDEYGRAPEEPRHPDFASGKAWPILAQNREAARQ